MARYTIKAYNKVFAKITQAFGKINPQMIMDNSPEEICNKFLNSKGIKEPENKSLEAKIEILDTLIACDNKPVENKKYASNGLDSNYIGLMSLINKK